MMTESTSSTAFKTCGEVLVDHLEGYGVDTVFGIPGVHTVELYRGLPNTKIRHITPRHEQGAGFMADGFARTSGKPGVCFIITGPGMTNIATAMGQAYADSIPMLVISSVNKTHELALGDGRLHELNDQSALISGVSAFSHTLQRVEELPTVLARAFAVFSGERPRPVHIEIPIDLITADASHIPLSIAAVPAKPAPQPAAIAEAAKRLAAAKNPILLFGGGCIDAGKEAVELMELLSAPGCCTINAKGIWPADHPLSLGSNQSLVPVRERVAAADVVLAVGTELGETDYDVVFDGQFHIHGQIIRIDIDPVQTQRNFMPSLAIVSDAQSAIAAISDQLKTAHGLTTDVDASAVEAVATINTTVDADWPSEWAGQLAVLNTIQTTLDDPIIVGDSTQPVYSGNHLYHPTAPRRWFNSSTGFGTLGYALPAALGAKIAAPERPVVSLIGDGGIQFTLSEIASAVGNQIPIVILLWNNHGYGEIKKYMVNRELPTIGVDIYTPDFLKLAEGFGCHADRAESFAQLESLLTAAQSRTVPSIIEVHESADFLTTATFA